MKSLALGLLNKLVVKPAVVVPEKCMAPDDLPINKPSDVNNKVPDGISDALLPENVKNVDPTLATASEIFSGGFGVFISRLNGP